MVENKCVWYDLARKQRGEEDERHLDHQGTHGFESQGCYDCDGKDEGCERYVLRRNFGREGCEKYMTSECSMDCDYATRMLANLHDDEALLKPVRIPEAETGIGAMVVAPRDSVKCRNTNEGGKE